MNVLFLVPPERRPYELSYFCNFSPDKVIVAVNRDTYETYRDWFCEFDDIDIAFLRKRKGPFARLFHSTASDSCYDEKQLADLIKKGDIDVIVTVELFSFLSRQASILCRRFSLPHVVIVWENISSHPFYHLPLFKDNADFVRKNVSRIIAVTTKSRNSLIALKIPTEKVNVIYPGVFLDKFKPRIVEKEFSVLFVGGLEKHKGFHLLLRVFENLCRKYDNLTVGVVGDGKLRGKLFEMKRKYGEEKFVYSERIPHSEIHLVYPKAEIFCFPSFKQKILNLFLIREEQFGFSLVEAMASGLPVVATNTDVIQEIVGSTKVLFSEGNTKEFESIMSTLIEDDTMRKRFSVWNRKKAEINFNAKKQSAKLRNYLTDEL